MIIVSDSLKNIGKIESYMDRLRKKLIFVVIFLLTTILNGRIKGSQEEFNSRQIRNFADHLFKTEDYLRAAIEYERYIFYSDCVNDTVLFKLGLSHQMRDQHEFAARSFAKIKNREQGNLIEEARIAYLYNLYKAEKWDSLKKVDYKSEEEFYFYYSAILHDSVNKKLDWREIDLSDSLMNRYKKLEQRKKHLKNKSPFVAGLLSTIVPGMGKWYLKRKGDAFYSFIITGLSGAVTYRSFCKKLLLTGIVGSGITLTFYLGSIYGSIIGTKIHNQKLYSDLYTDLEKLNPVNKKPYWNKWIKK